MPDFYASLHKRKAVTKIFPTLLFIAIALPCFSQSISGKVINEATHEPLCYASIGMINTNVGTITNEKGFFKLNIKGFSSEAKVRISMIGFESQIIQLKDLSGEENTIRLKEQSIQLSEVIVKPQKVKRKTIGTNSTSKKNVTGWGGCGNCPEDLSGIERGIRIDLSESVFLEKVNFHVAQLGFDSMLVRLHIRKIDNDSPGKELLNANIYAKIKLTGWQEIDLQKYNLTFSQDIAVSIEWVKGWSHGKDSGNNLKFSVGVLQGTLFAKDGLEDKWVVMKHVSPAIYLTVEEL